MRLKEQHLPVPSAFRWQGPGVHGPDILSGMLADDGEEDDTMAHDGWNQHREAAFQALMTEWRGLYGGPRERLDKAREALSYLRQQLKQPGWAASYEAIGAAYDTLHGRLADAVDRATLRPPLYDPVEQDASDPNRPRKD